MSLISEGELKHNVGNEPFTLITARSMKAFEHVREDVWLSFML
jgi:hypothetical protein